MSNISPNPGEMSEELVTALRDANSTAEMQEIQRQWLVDHGAERDKFSPDKLIFDNFKSPDADATGRVSRIVKIRGVDALFSATSVSELEQQISIALQGVSEDGSQPRGSDGKFVSRRELNAAEKVELDLRFRRGEMTAPEYLKASGEIENAFDTYAKEKLGLDPDLSFRRNWATATEEFLNSPEGAEWPGGDANREIAGKLIADNNLTDQPSAETLARVFAHMVEHNLVQPNPELEKQKKDKFDAATSAEEINSLARAALGMPPRNSNIWGK